MFLNSSPNIYASLLINYITSEGPRLISTVGAYPFYCSTGKNSGSKGTFFPFQGILQHDMTSQYSKGWFVKPSFSYYKTEDLFPPTLTSFLEELSPKLSHTDNIIERFGNIETMVISCLIGTGFWTEAAGKAISSFLNLNFSGYIDEIYQKNMGAIDFLRRIEEIPYEEIQSMSPERLNEVNILLAKEIRLFPILCWKINGHIIIVFHLKSCG